MDRPDEARRDTQAEMWLLVTGGQRAGESAGGCAYCNPDFPVQHSIYLTIMHLFVEGCSFLIEAARTVRHQYHLLKDEATRTTHGSESQSTTFICVRGGTERESNEAALLV